MDAVDRLGWAATSTFHVGDLHLGVRSNTPQVDELLRRVLKTHLVEGVQAPPNYSVRMDLGHGGPSKVKPLNVLYHSSTLAIRARSPHRVVAGLVSYLSAHATPGEGLLTLTAAVVDGRGRAVLVPRELLSALEVIQGRLQRHGLRFVDRLIVGLDPATAELVVGPNLVDVDEFEPVGGHGGRDLPTVAPGRYPVVAWALFHGPGIKGPMSRAASVAAASRSVLSLRSHPRETLEGLAQVFEQVRGTAVWANEPAAAADQLVALAASR